MQKAQHELITELEIANNIPVNIKCWHNPKSEA